MVTCALGASVKAGVSPTAQVVISRSLWESLTGTPASWLDTILDTFTPSVVTVSDLCTLNVVDPADLPLSTIVHAILSDPLALGEVEVWAKEKLSYLAFQANCVCNAPGGTCDSLFGRPIPPLADSNTNGSSDYDLGMKFHCNVGGDLTSFGFGQFGGTFPRTETFRLWNLTAGTLLWTQTATLTAGTYQEIAASTVTSLVAGVDYAITFRYQVGHSINCLNAGWGGASTTHISSTGRIDNFSSGVGAPTRFFTGLCVPIQPIVCPGVTTPPAPVVPIQPADLILPPAWSCGTTGDICTRLQQISDRVDWLRKDVTLIQRQSTPFAYLPGVTYSGLTGHGTISVSAILGVSVSLTTVPTSWGKTQDTPRRLIPAAGQILFSTTDGDSDAQLLHYDQNLILGVSGAVTSIKYSLRQGIVASITPLAREF